MKKLIIATIVSVSFLSGCASTGNTALGTLDSTQVTSMIQDGVTTKQQIIAALGDPTVVDLDNQSREKWTYEHKKSTAKVINFVPVASAFTRGTNDTVKQLVVLFDDDGIVKKHIFSTAQGETNVGLLG